jgi:hypothetical protein
MDKKWLAISLVALPLLVGGFVLASGQSSNDAAQSPDAAYVCPITGEELHCPGCCPLNDSK